MRAGLRVSCVVLLLTQCASAQLQGLPEQQAYEIGVKAYIFSYPFVLLDRIKEDFSVNQLRHSQRLANPSFRGGGHPNVDTLYSNAWLDLASEPMLLSMPDTNGRYFIVQFMDAWTETFAAPGSRTIGTKTAQFAIVGPNWEGQLPSDVQTLKSPTNGVWMLGRIQTNGESDYAEVNAIRQRMRLVPLSKWRREEEVQSIPPRAIQPQVTPAMQIANMDAVKYFETFASALKHNQPHAEDGAMVEELKKIGIEVGKDFNGRVLSPDVLRGLNRAILTARQDIAGRRAGSGTNRNGWNSSATGNRFGANYFDRAVAAMTGIGGLTQDDALYMSASLDSDGTALSGANSYVIHFNRDGFPPVNAFWSITVYHPEGFLVENPINRYAIRDRDKMQYNIDGSLDIFLQHDDPGPNRASNWLPVPEGPFDLSMRLYWPKPEAFNGGFVPPTVVRQKK